MTTASTGAGRGVRVRAAIEDIGRQQRTRQVRFLLEEPLGEGIASTLPPPLVRVPSEGPFPRPWLPRDIPLTRVAEPRPQEVQPPAAISSRELLAPLEEVIPPAAAMDAEIPVSVEVPVPPASAPSLSSPGAEAVPLLWISPGELSNLSGIRPSYPT